MKYLKSTSFLLQRCRGLCKDVGSYDNRELLPVLFSTLSQYNSTSLDLSPSYSVSVVLKNYQLVLEEQRLVPRVGKEVPCKKLFLMLKKTLTN